MNEKCNLFCKLKKRLLGDLLLSGSFVKKEDVEKALEEQKKTNKLIGELLIELGAISKEELNIVLHFQEDLSNPHKALKFATGLRKKLGELLIGLRRITEQELEEALALQKNTGKKIGEILIEKGIISKKELEAVLLFQKTQEEKTIHKRLKLGELLVSLGIITRDQLNQALKIQTLHPEKRLGEILFELGYVTKEDIEKGLTLQQKLATVALSTLITFSTSFFVNELQAQEPGNAITKGRVRIVAEVKSYAKLNLAKQIGEIVISERDIATKTKEIKNATTIDLKTNTNAIFVVFEGFSDGLIEEVEVYGFGESVKLGPNGGMVLIKSPAKTMKFDLSYRLKLSDNARNGTYAWPFSISVSTF